MEPQSEEGMSTNTKREIHSHRYLRISASLTMRDIKIYKHISATSIKHILESVKKVISDLVHLSVHTHTQAEITRLPM